MIMTLLKMEDSAYPVTRDQSGVDVILIYSGGDTIHPWTHTEILDMPARWRLPTWVRSNPQSVNAMVDAASFLAWLHGFGTPIGSTVCLDLETAVNTLYVTTFNNVLHDGGYPVMKYGSQSTIWQNPRTHGGTFLALPGPAELTGEGDEVARQYAFDGDYDLSVIESSVKLWDVHPPAVKPGQWRKIVVTVPVSLKGLAERHKTNEAAILWETSIQHPRGLGPMERAYFDAGDWNAHMKPGTVVYVPA
jgi:hypothetical protein